MSRGFLRLKIFSCLVFIGLSNLVYSQNKPTNPSKPNIVLILIDDSGLMDLGVFGGEARTPNIDRLANNGMMFTNMHASPVCAPSRAMLLTGTNSHLAGVANLPEFLPAEYQGKPGYGGVLNDKVQTIATRLKELYYNTYAAGKWHLGHDENTLPNRRGFDRSFILGSSGANNYQAKGYLPMKPVAHWYADGKETELPNDFYSSKSYIDKIISFHQQEKKKNQPFFSYIAFQAIHAPVQAPKKFVNHYLDTYKQGWDKIRERRFKKAKEMGIIPKNAKLGAPFTPLKKWEELSKEEQKDYAMSLAVTAGMLEAMDYHIGRYIAYLKKEGLFENTVFIVTSDNGPDGAEYVSNLYLMNAVGLKYHRDYQNKPEKDYYGSLEPGFATAVAAPFDYFKYYTGEGGLRVPLIISGPNLPKQTRSDVFCFFTDIAPTIYDLLGLSTSANKGFAPITGKSMLPHIKDANVPVYARGEGIGLEAANSAAYFLDGYKIVKNNIPLGDMEWHLYDLVNDPLERNDLVNSNPELFQKMLVGYQKFAKEVGVIEMPKGYSASGEVTKKSMRVLFWKFSPYFLALLLFIIGLIIGIWRWRRKKSGKAI
ncbi:MAG: arylsulfatase [Microscillaceae bacterium]|nr:arylsulfatase [Microscillaceae bacterium]